MRNCLGLGLKHPIVVDDAGRRSAPDCSNDITKHVSFWNRMMRTEDVTLVVSKYLLSS